MPQYTPRNNKQLPVTPRFPTTATTTTTTTTTTSVGGLGGVCRRMVLLIDSSGSMSSQKNDIIGGVNETIKKQRLANPAENDLVNFNIVTFSDNVSNPSENTLANVPFLNQQTYIPSGSTALFDAMGSVMERYQNEHCVIMIVATDGEENASKKYKYSQITDMVKRLKDSRDWNFIYLSEDIDTFKQGESMGISTQSYNCNNICMPSKGNLGTYMSSSICQDAVTQMRSGVKNVKLTSSKIV